MLLLNDYIEAIKTANKRVSDKQAEMIARKSIQGLIKILSEGQELKLEYLGSWKLKQMHGGKKGRNFKTGESIVTKPKLKLVFTPAEDLYAKIKSNFSE